MYFVLYIPELVGGAPRGAGLKGKVVMIFHCEHKVNFNFFLNKKHDMELIKTVNQQSKQ